MKQNEVFTGIVKSEPAPATDFSFKAKRDENFAKLKEASIQEEAAAREQISESNGKRSLFLCIYSN